MAQKTKRGPTFIAGLVFGVFLILAIGIAERRLSSPGSTEPLSWNTGANADIARTLKKHDIQGCDQQMRWRLTQGYAQEFVVQCAPDGKYNVEYLVGAASERIEGPFRLGGSSK